MGLSCGFRLIPLFGECNSQDSSNHFGPMRPPISCCVHQPICPARYVQWMQVSHRAEPAGFTEPDAAVSGFDVVGVFMSLGWSRRVGEPGRSADTTTGLSRQVLALILRVQSVPVCADIS